MVVSIPPYRAFKQVPGTAAVAYIGHVPQTEGDGVEMEGVVFERQSLGVSLAKPQKPKRTETARTKPSNCDLSRHRNTGGVS